MDVSAIGERSLRTAHLQARHRCIIIHSLFMQRLNMYLIRLMVAQALVCCGYAQTYPFTRVQPTTRIVFASRRKLLNESFIVSTAWFYRRCICRGEANCWGERILEKMLSWAKRSQCNWMDSSRMSPSIKFSYNSCHVVPVHI